MAAEKWNRVRKLDGWEQLIVNIALGELLKKWTKNPDEYGISPATLRDLEEFNSIFAVANEVLMVKK